VTEKFDFTTTGITARGERYYEKRHFKIFAKYLTMNDGFCKSIIFNDDNLKAFIAGRLGFYKK